MDRLARLLCFTLALVYGAVLPAQGAADAAPDFLRSVGKIYVVVAVIVVVFLGLALYLWRLDRRLTSIEKQIDDHA